MTAKRFKEFILESREPSTDGRAKLFFGPDSKIEDILGKGLLYLRTGGLDEEEKILEIMSKLGEVLEVNLIPVLVASEMGSTNLWFQADEEPSPVAIDAAYWKASNTLWGTFVFLDLEVSPDSQAQRVGEFVEHGGRLLSADQLVELSVWLENAPIRDRRSPYYIDELVKKIKELPNWPEDWTDWALGDW